MNKSLNISSLLFFLLLVNIYSQDISLYSQFNGRYDYIAIGNTMNLQENGLGANCVINTSSSANLDLLSSQPIEVAYLYWAGSGDGDFDVRLNDIDITAERTFNNALDANRTFFAAFADITTMVQTTGNGSYTLSDLDLTSIIPLFCSTGTNFGGWAIIIIYKDDSLPLNQVNVYDGLQSVPTSLTIVLDNLNVIDNEDAKIGFLAWEGDSSLAVNEQLTINGNVIGNPPLNPDNNTFNGTNSFTGQSNLYNMDIDVYNIQNNIAIGDNSATIQLTSGQDFVMINNIITVLNSQLPDATAKIDHINIECNTRQIMVDFTIYNTNSTETLIASTPIVFYANDELIGQSETLNPIGINESESNNIILNIPENIDTNFILSIVVDDDGTGNGIVTEINENNNVDSKDITLLFSPEPITLPDMTACDIAFDKAEFNLTNQLINIADFNVETAQFFNSLDAALNLEHEILNPEFYTNTSNPQTLYITTQEEPCHHIFQFTLTVENCPPIIPDGFSPNNDGFNDWFNIQGLYNIFEKHELLIYNRYGSLIFKGNNEKRWDGKVNRGLNDLGKILPVGTYFYVLHLNDINYKPLTGWVYLNR